MPHNRKEGLFAEVYKLIKKIPKGKVVTYGQVDFVVNGRVVVEVKAAVEIKPIHKMQLLSYLKFTNKKVGLILNFGAPVLQIKQVVN